MKNLIPALDWIQNYKKEYLTGDLTAGLTVGVMLIPQGMAYSMLAGLPPIYGLYASTIPLIIYALFGTSRQLAVGPVAMVALLISSGVGALATIGSNEFIALAILLALMVGVIQFAMGIFKLGFLVNFLSHPVIAGFTSAAAIIIGFSQLKHLLGFNIPRGKVHEIILNVIENFGSINVPTLLIGAGAIALLLIIKSINKKIPGPLLAVLFGIGAVYFLGLHEQGVKIVKDVPGGLDIFGIPSIDLTSVTSLIPVALTIAFIGFMESIAVAKAIQAKHKDYEVTANKELIGLGLANIIGSFFKAFPVTGGFSRTAVNDQAGARTGLSPIISAVLIIFTLLFLTEY
ncbi:MAG: sodium-independent anion transporter, partial [Bacteroidia bacterium]|nr:sodium-independent anion transporter [Bacteroidia bacterium]